MVVCDLCKKPDGKLEHVSVPILTGEDRRAVDLILHQPCTEKLVKIIGDAICTAVGEAAAYLNWPGKK